MWTNAWNGVYFSWEESEIRLMNKVVTGIIILIAMLVIGSVALGFLLPAEEETEVDPTFIEHNFNQSVNDKSL